MNIIIIIVIAIVLYYVPKPDTALLFLRSSSNLAR